MFSVPDCDGETRINSFDDEQWILISMKRVLTEAFYQSEASTVISFRGAMLNLMESQIPITLGEIVLILWFRSLK